ncbi:ferritin light chain-like [Suncus etruscus]|uniref:ferritin light chain-like n=1 Tax=Suncus etruscus TaxID=109475 RepID=UPI00210F46D8|nr:ferritin light chain-like [Suncus etruscus]
MNVRFRQVKSSKIKVAINNVATMHLQASDTYMSLGFYFQCQAVSVDGMSTFFRKLAEEKQEVARSLLKQSRLQYECPLTHQESRSCEWSSSQHAMEVALELEKSLYREVLELQTLASANKDTDFVAFLEDQFLGKEAELIKQMRDYLTIICRLSHPQLSLSKYFFKRPTCKQKYD